MITIKTYLDTRRQKKDGTYPIKIRVTNKGNGFLISTGIFCKRENWETNEITKGEIGYKAKNSRLLGKNG